MARPEYFQRNAATCMAAALRSENLPDRTAWMMRAERWLELAQEAESKADDEPLTPGQAGQTTSEPDLSKGAAAKAARSLFPF